MKIDRLIGIITTLQQKGRVTAPYLAEKFEVSRRTINRDIEDICRAGIPIVTVQGANGGVQIMDGFTIDTTVFTEDELQTIFAGLKGLDSVSHSPKSQRLTEKIGGVIPVADNMIIDLASFYKDSLSEKIDLLKTAIRDRKRVKFHYYYNKGEDDKTVEPALIVFKWTSWYMFGFCPERDDFRMYKLGRLWDLTLTDETFTPREIPSEKMNFGGNMSDDIIIKAIYEPEEKYKLVEEYGPYSFRVMEDGRLYTEWGFTYLNNALGWFLSFGSNVEVLSPPEFKQLYLDELKKMADKYK
ncbi:MAG: YafY family transcriptional regulator [Eubacterium sp.]|nr:YafY family transcriptional regulator [Eubacterium sp.]